ncbi:MAG TPA: hypothetical protein VET48_07955 [Steroidobacteraceae bacterium]|nr:hypothetical protein [Steroidobacteraceae bacterium]
MSASHKILSVLVAMLCLTSLAGGQATLKSPQEVRMALHTLDQSVAQTGQLIGAEQITQLRGEIDKTASGITSLRLAIANESAAFKARLEPLLAKTARTANALSAAAKKSNATALSSAHEQFSVAVRNLIDAFPEDVRPMMHMERPAGPPVN